MVVFPQPEGAEMMMNMPSFGSLTLPSPPRGEGWEEGKLFDVLDLLTDFFKFAFNKHDFG